jgi:hypothetical protein
LLGGGAVREKRYEPGRVPDRDGQDWGVIDHHGFRWVRGADDKIVRFASCEEANAWIENQRDANVSASL